MKKLMVMTALVVYPLCVLFAHPASEVKADYKIATKTLSVDVKHLVSKSKNTDTTKHFIKEITVTVNGKNAKTQTFTSQTGDLVKATFDITAKAGDKIKVTATCSLAGSKSTEITVKK
jgi:desulfoferrodoxin (superoxide reductase-like protein)